MLWPKYLVCANLVAAWTIQNGGVTVSGQGDVGEKVAFKSLSEPVSFYADQSLVISFKVPETPGPHQVALRMYNADEKPLNKFLMAKMKGKTARFVVPFGSLPVEMHNHALDVNVLISGLNGTTYEEKIFSCIPHGSENTSLENTIEKSGRNSELSAKPQIFNQFSGLPKQVNSIFAMAFVATNLILFGALCLAFCTIVAEKPLTSVLSGFSSVTLATLLLIEGTFFQYYLKISIFTVIRRLMLLVPLLLFFSTRLYKSSVKV